jgi:pyruvate/2-oxoglutarate dehydrogenase complex dihydrolipoamide acyltransferase (E2) component
MHATVYHRPAPGAPPFVQPGAAVHAGQTLALLEAMKMFTELTSPVDGVVVDILVEHAQGVTTGTPLFKIAPQETSPETVDDLLLQDVDTPLPKRFGFTFTAATAEGRRCSQRLALSPPLATALDRKALI